MSYYGFIGCGNMGGALAAAAAKSVDKKEIYVSGKDKSESDLFAQKHGVNSSDNITIAKSSDILFLGVKPQVLGQVLNEIAPALKSNENCVVVSMAAAITINKIVQMLGFEPKIIRIMPNTPVFVNEGMTVYDANSKVSEEEINKFLEVLKFAGQFDRLDEDKIDAAGALSGCGPAYAYIFLEALADGAVSLGIPRDKAERYAAQTLLGAAAMMLNTGKKPGELKDSVCSPGGTTIEGVAALEKAGFRSAAIDACVAAYNKTKKLAGK
ncbi:MAG: pyrroline-5-carboxylate reductase [Acutalibacteraceae bacterium]|nr:pyrroline-5-carboxylate reductase [Acutalibacteraceae bacterium]